MATPKNRAILSLLCPRLDTEGYQVICPVSKDYNCIAFAAGDTEQWWDHTEQGYWPPEVERSHTLEALTAVFRTLGFVVTDDPDLESGYEKIALYADSEGYTHAALQMLDGKWRSKMGDLELIEHRAPASLNGGRYGNAEVYMRRRR